MKTLNVGKILLLCAFVIGLASCGEMYIIQWRMMIEAMRQDLDR